MTTLPQMMIQEKLRTVEQRRMDIHPKLPNHYPNHYSSHYPNHSPKHYTDPVTHPNMEYPLHNNPQMFVSKFQLPPSSDRTKPSDADYVNFSEIVRLRKEIRLLEKNRIYNHHHHHHRDHYQECGNGKHFVFEDIPREILEVVDKLIESGEDIEEHFNAIDDVAFKQRIFQSNFSEKDLESDTDSGNGTMQTENGSLSSQTLQDILSEPVQKPEEQINQKQKVSVESINPFLLRSTILSTSEMLDDFTELPHFTLLPPPPEFCEDNKGLFVKGLNANRGAIKKGLIKSPVVLDKIPGTYLSQSCIDLSQISPKRRVTFADELVSSVHSSFSDVDEDFVDYQTRIPKTRIIKSTPKAENDIQIKSKSFNVFKFLSKKHQNDKEKDSQTKKKFKKKSKQSSNSKLKDETNDDPFYPDDFDDFSSDDDSCEDDSTKEKQDSTFLTAFSSNVQITTNATNFIDIKAPEKITTKQNSRNNLSEEVELKRGSVDRIIEKNCKPSKQERNSTPEFPTHSKLQKDRPQFSPLKKFKLRFHQLHFKGGGDDKKSKKQRLAIENLDKSAEERRKDVNEALMNSDDECDAFLVSKTSKDPKSVHPTSKQQFSSHYFPVPFSKKLSESKKMSSPVNVDSAINFTESSNIRKINFETFLGSNGLKSVKSQTDDRTPISFKIGMPYQFVENNHHSKYKIVQNLPRNLTNHALTSNNSKGQPCSSFIDTKNTNRTVESEETYLNYSDILLITENTNLQKSVAGHSTSFMNIKNIQQSKPPILKVKPCLKETTDRDKANKSPFKIHDLHPLHDDSTEKVLKHYDSSRDVECKAAMNRCYKLSQHLRTMVKINNRQIKTEINNNVSDSDGSLLATSLQKLKSLCLRLVSDGKSMIIASTSFKSTFPERVANSIHSLADFSLELKHFGRIDKNESNFECLINQFLLVIDLFELTIDASEDLSRELDDTSLKLKSLLELANELAKGLSSLLKIITITNPQKH